MRTGFVRNLNTCTSFHANCYIKFDWCACVVKKNCLYFILWREQNNSHCCPYYCLQLPPTEIRLFRLLNRLHFLLVRSKSYSCLLQLSKLHFLQLQVYHTDQVLSLADRSGALHDHSSYFCPLHRNLLGGDDRFRDYLLKHWTLLHLSWLAKHTISLDFAKKNKNKHFVFFIMWKWICWKQLNIKKNYYNTYFTTQSN